MISAQPRLALMLGGACALFAVVVFATVKIAASDPRGSRPAGREPHLVAAAASLAAGVGGRDGQAPVDRDAGPARVRDQLPDLSGRRAGVGASVREHHRRIAGRGWRADPCGVPGRAIANHILRARRDQPGSRRRRRSLPSNRSESYPFTVQMLYEQNGWQIAQVVPVDLSTDDHIQPARRRGRPRRRHGRGPAVRGRIRQLPRRRHARPSGGWGAPLRQVDRPGHRLARADPDAPRTGGA